MEHLETTIRKIIKKGFDILNNRSNSIEREVQFYVVLPVLEELGYPKENFFIDKHCRVDKKDLYSDVYIEVDNGTGILVETKKAKKELTSSCLSQLYTYLGVETIKWGILTNGSGSSAQLRIILVKAYWKWYTICSLFDKEYRHDKCCCK